MKVGREKAFDAWLSADRLARFLCAGDTHVESVEVDPRVGGAFRVVMASADGAALPPSRPVSHHRPPALNVSLGDPVMAGQLPAVVRTQRYTSGRALGMTNLQ